MVASENRAIAKPCQFPEIAAVNASFNPENKAVGMVGMIAVNAAAK